MLLRRTLAELMAAATLLPAGLAAQARRPLTRIAFGSCAEQADSQPIWDAILAYKPELFIFAGDNVYGDFNTADAGPLRKA
jgi:alkaline phosphatase D